MMMEAAVADNKDLLEKKEKYKKKIPQYDFHSKQYGIFYIVK